VEFRIPGFRAFPLDIIIEENDLKNKNLDGNLRIMQLLMRKLNLV